MVRPIFLSLFLILTPLIARADAACDCPDLSCSPCEVQVGLSFYTKTCPGSSRLASCKKPSCEPKKDAPPNCPSAAQAPASSPVTDDKETTPDSGAPEQKRVIAVVVQALGQTWAERESEKIPLQPKVELFETDTLQTEDSSKLRIAFVDENGRPDKNELFVAPNSKIQISKYRPGNSPSRRAWMDLFYGKVRSAVNNRYESEGKNTFRIKTPVAVAGVRGTEFMVTHYEGARTTKIETFSGLVRMSALQGSDFRDIGAKHRGAYVGSVTPGQKGVFTSVEGLNEKQALKLRQETEFLPDDENALLAKAAKNQICARPSGAFNQCSWVCMGNPQNATTCRTDLPGVHCLRKRCNANGEWAEETRVPASRSQHCDSDTRVAPCEY